VNVSTIAIYLTFLVCSSSYMSGYSSLMCCGGLYLGYLAFPPPMVAEAATSDKLSTPTSVA